MKSKLTSFFLILVVLNSFGQVDKKIENSESETQKDKDNVNYKLTRENLKRNSFETWFVPGAAYTFFYPERNDSVGHFSGVAVNYLLMAKNDKRNRSGPGLVRVYSRLNISKSSKEDISSMFMYSLGIDLSLEKAPKRNWMIPYFGLEAGGMSQKQFGSTLQFTPTLGLHLFSKKNLMVNAYGGYVYPVKNFEMLQGWFAQAGVNFSLW